LSKEYFEKYHDVGKANYDPENESIIRAYITFRSMDAMETIDNSYKRKNKSRYLCLCVKTCCPKKDEHYIGETWPDPVRAEVPD
jgi:hypothetical protein